jgi:hypothetical protein
MQKIPCLGLDSGIDKTHDEFYDELSMFLSHVGGREDETPCIYKLDARHW